MSPPLVLALAIFGVLVSFVFPLAVALYLYAESGRSEDTQGEPDR